MINITLRQLRYFDALARHGHFGRAAEACAISQPALSMQIKEMEQALGGVLLERNARQVALTKFGEELAERVRVRERGPRQPASPQFTAHPSRESPAPPQHGSIMPCRL